jgi:hypothetical protein
MTRSPITTYGILAPVWRARRRPDPTNLGRPLLRWLVFRHTDEVTTDLFAVEGWERISAHWTLGAARRAMWRAQ